MCPRNESDLGNTLPWVTNLKTFPKKILAVRAKALKRKRKKRKKEK